MMGSSVIDNANEYKYQTGITPLHFAAESGNVECVQFLLDNGCDANASAMTGKTPLHYAAKNIEIMKILISSGADPLIKDNLQKTALEYAAEKCTNELDASEIIDLAISNNADCKAIFFAAACKGNSLILEALLAKGADPNFENERGQTALHVAAANGSINIIDLLSNYDADPNWEDHIGDSPLHTAVKSMQEKIALKLISIGADVDQKNNNGKTPRSIAKEKGLEI